MNPLRKLGHRLRIRTRLREATARVLSRSGGWLGIPRLDFYCPACEHPVVGWLPLRRSIGHGEARLEAGGRLCPLCKSLERTRHFALYLEQTSLLDGRPRMLHFAPERGLATRLRARLGDRYVTTDLFMRGVDRREDITRMRFPDGSFDLVYCSNVLEHIEDDRQAMAELFRVLAPGGTAILQVPIRGATTYEDPSITDPRERYEHFGQSDHVRYYGEDIRQRLETVGFEVEPFVMLDRLDLRPGDIERMNLDARELVHRCRKPARGG